MDRAQLLMAVQHIAVRVPLPIQGQPLSHRLQRYPLGRGPLSAAVKQPVVAPLLIAPLPAPHLAIRDLQNLRGLRPLQSSINGSQHHFLNLHRPLHRGSGVQALLHPNDLPP
jgi:hypothetical protein